MRTSKHVVFHLQSQIVVLDPYCLNTRSRPPYCLQQFKSSFFHWSWTLAAVLKHEFDASVKKHLIHELNRNNLQISSIFSQVDDWKVLLVEDCTTDKWHSRHITSTHLTRQRRKHRQETFFCFSSLGCQPNMTFLLFQTKLLRTRIVCY